MPDASIEAQLERALERLAEEFNELLDRQTVERVFIESTEHYRESRVRTYIPLLAERMARDTLRSLIHTQQNTAP